MMRLKEPPAEELKRVNQIFEFFRSRIKEQDSSIFRLSTTLVDVMHRKQSAWGLGKPLLYKFTLAGTSSSGKTETVLALRHYLGMEPGYKYQQQYIELDGGTMSEPNELSVLIGKKGDASLADRLNSALRNEEDEYCSPPYIMLFIDNLDRASSDALNMLHDFLGSGTFTGQQNGRIFNLPAQTALLIVSTFGTQELCKMNHRDDMMAENLVQCAMTKRGIRKETIERLSQILPYYPLDDKILRRILTEKLDEYVETSVITSRFGEKMVIYLGDAKTILVNHVLTKMKSEYGGIRGSIRELFLKLNVLFATSLGVLEEMLEQSQENALSQPLSLSACTFNTQQFGESLAHQLDPIIRLIKENPDNQQTLALCDLTTEGEVNAVAMAYGEVALCSLVMNITYNHYHLINHYDSKESGRVVNRLKDEVKGLKGALKQIISTVDNANQITSFNEHLKQLADHSRELIEASSLDDDDKHDDQMNRKRKRTAPLNASVSVKKKSLISSRTLSDSISLSYSSASSSSSSSSSSIEELPEDLRALLDGTEEYDENLSCFSSATDDRTEEEEEEEEEEEKKAIKNHEGQNQCIKCKKWKSLDVFQRKRRRADASTYIACAKLCSVCRK